MHSVARHATRAGVLENQRRVSRLEVPPVGPGLAREARLVIVRGLRHPQRVRLSHARPVVGEEHALACVDARRHAGLGLAPVESRLCPGHAEVQSVGLPVQERDRLANVGPERRDEVVGLRLSRALLAPVARVVVAAEQLAGRKRLVRVPLEALVGVPSPARRLHDDEVARGHRRDDHVLLPGRDVDAVKPHAPHPSESPACRRLRRRARS